MNNQPNRLLNIIRNRTSRSQNTERESHSNNFNLNTISDIPLSIQEDSLSNIFQDIESIRNRIPWYFRSGRFRSSVIIQSDSDNDLSIDHSDDEYIDFRQYPYKLDFKEVEDEKTEAYEIVKDHGYLGLALYTHFGQYLNNLNTDNLIPSLLRHYCNTNPSKSKNCNEMDFDSLLSLEGLKEVLNKKLFSDRDLLPMKVLLSIYENHLKDPSDIKHTRRYLDDLMPVVSLFYSSLTDEQIEKLKIKLDKSKGILKNLIRSRKILNLSSRLKYMAHYNKVKTQIKTLIDGLQNEKFYM